MFDSLIPILPFVIPIVAIVMALSIPIVAIITEYSKRRRFYELHHKERLAAIEKGIEVPPLPPELFGTGRTGRPRFLLRGLVWLFVGLGSVAGLYGISGHEEQKFWLLGLVPTGVGCAYLLYYLVEGKRVEAEAAQAQAERAQPPRCA